MLGIGERPNVLLKNPSIGQKYIVLFLASYKCFPGQKYTTKFLASSNITNLCLKILQIFITYTHKVLVQLNNYRVGTNQYISMLTIKVNFPITIVPPTTCPNNNSLSMHLNPYDEDRGWWFKIAPTYITISSQKFPLFIITPVLSNHKEKYLTLVPKLIRLVKNSYRLIGLLSLSGMLLLDPDNNSKLWS